MFKQRYHVIGVMSGTSLDGIDMAQLEFEYFKGKWNYKILQTETIPYSKEWIQILKNVVDLPLSKLHDINEEYTDYLGLIIKDFIKKNQIKNLDAVCSHGHTLLHQPQNKLTLQIGNLPKIAKVCNQKIIGDFRVQDVLLGGQGAPLVPIGDKLLFSEFDYCLNLGGFSNISFDEDSTRIAFDISPINIVLNHYASLLGLPYDDQGILSSKGIVNNKLLEELNALDFYKRPYPKSLGFEYVKETILPTIEKHIISIEDKMRTFIEHIALQTQNVLTNKKGKLLITGGGAYNTFLIDRIKQSLPHVEIIIPDSKTIEFKEALIFGFLGVLKLRNEINALCSVTGAKKDHSAGYIFEI